jgi:hypothetical protein
VTKNTAQSVRDRLLKLSKEGGEDFNFVLVRPVGVRADSDWDGAPGTKTGEPKAQSQPALPTLCREGSACHPLIGF